MADNNDNTDRFTLFDAARHSAIFHAVQIENKKPEEIVAAGATVDQLLEEWRSFALAALHSGDGLQAAVAADVMLLEYRLRIERAFGPLLPAGTEPAAAPPAAAAVAPAPVVAVAAAPPAVPAAPAIPPVVFVPLASPAPAPIAASPTGLDPDLAIAAGLAVPPAGPENV